VIAVIARDRKTGITTTDDTEGENSQNCHNRRPPGMSPQRARRTQEKMRIAGGSSGIESCKRFRILVEGVGEGVTPEIG
jgi:hypothetical protein